MWKEGRDLSDKRSGARAEGGGAGGGAGQAGGPARALPPVQMVELALLLLGD